MHRLAPVALGLLLIACSGGKGCSGGGLAPIKGGFPPAQRQENAVQLRLTQGLFTFIQQNGAGLINQLLSGGKISVPSECGGSTEVCCGQTCSVSAQATGLNFNPSPPQTMQLALRAKIQTDEYLQVHYKSGIIDIKCGVSYDSSRKSPNDVGLQIDMVTSVDMQTKLTSVNFGNANIQDLQEEDIDINGGFLCQVANSDLIKGKLIGKIKDLLVQQLNKPLAGALCKKCMTQGSMDECEGLASCAADKVCRNGPNCLQFLGVEGRLDLAALLGQAAGLDINLAAGGYAQVEGNGAGGLSLGMLGGALADPPSSCVPMRPAPLAPPPPQTAEYAGGTAPNGMPYHLGAGIATPELDLLGHGAYGSGALCLSLGTAQVALLNSGTLGVLMPSLSDLTREVPAAMELVLRPQQPPTFTLGKGTFKTDGMGRKTIDDPLLLVGMKDFAIDFYLYMDQHYVRVMRMTADLSVPLGLDVDDMGRLVPILGDLAQGFQNVRVSNSALLKESPQALAAMFPHLLPILVGQIGNSIKPITLPSVMGFSLLPVQITSTPDMQGKLSFLGLFFQLEAPKGMARVETRASLLQLEQGQQPRAVLRIDADSPQGRLEWQVAVDGGLWQPFDDQHERVVDDPVLRLPGQHFVEVRARVAGQPQTLDPTPARVEFLVAPAAPVRADTQPQRLGVSAQGTTAACGCSAMGTGRGSPGALLLLLPLLLLGLGYRRRLGSLSLLFYLGLGLSQACSSNMDVPVTPGDQLDNGDEIGRYQSAVTSGDTIYISAYDSTEGDLAFVQVRDPQAKLAWQVIDGLPSGPPDNMMAGAPRRGYTAPGPDVGRFTSLALTSKGVPVIAYQDADAGAVKLARGPVGSWQISVVDMPKDGSKLGMFTALSLGSDDRPAVAYMAVGVPKADSVVAQLVLSLANTATPSGPGDWTRQVIDEAVTCSGKTCMAKGPTPAQDLPKGTGLYVRFLPGGAAGQLLYYDRDRGALRLAAGPAWKPMDLAGGDGKADVGAHIGAQLQGDGTLHVAYVDAAANQLLYRSVKGGMAGPAEVVDDGSRGGAMDRESHWVGAGAVLFLDGSTPKVAYQDQTAGTLELAQRDMGWTHDTKAMGGTRGSGFYPQAVQLSGKWVLPHVVYDRNRQNGALSAVEFAQP